MTKIIKLFTVDEIRKKIETNDYCAELLLLHAMENIQQLERRLSAAEFKITKWRRRAESARNILLVTEEELRNIEQHFPNWRK